MNSKGTGPEFAGPKVDVLAAIAALEDRIRETGGGAFVVEVDDTGAEVRTLDEWRASRDTGAGEAEFIGDVIELLNADIITAKAMNELGSKAQARLDALRSPEPAQAEPVAWMLQYKDHPRQLSFNQNGHLHGIGWTETPLYAHPPAQAEALTKEQTIEAVQCLLDRGKATLDADGHLVLVERYVAQADQQPPEDVVERPRIASAEINALPENVRRYIMFLETDCDPAGTIRSEMLLRDQVEALELRLKESSAREEQARREGRQQAFEEAAKVAETYWVEADYNTVGIADADMAMELCKQSAAVIRAKAQGEGR